jgi:hypothetical protein
MRALGVVVGQPFSDPGAGFRPGFKRIEINAFIFQGSPEPLDHPVINPATFAIYYRQVICKITERHGYLDIRILQRLRPFKTGELAALISGLPYLVMASFKASTQKSASMLFDNRQLKTLRLYQSIIATKYKKPRCIGIYVISTHQTWLGFVIGNFLNK